MEIYHCERYRVYASIASNLNCDTDSVRSIRYRCSASYHFFLFYSAAGVDPTCEVVADASILTFVPAGIPALLQAGHIAELPGSQLEFAHG